jgi:hypothetical protein
MGNQQGGQSFGNEEDKKGDKNPKREEGILFSLTYRPT